MPKAFGIALPSALLLLLLAGCETDSGPVAVAAVRPVKTYTVGGGFADVRRSFPARIEAARRAGMRAVGICTTNTPEELAGTHVITCVNDYNELLQSNFLEKLHVAHA